MALALRTAALQKQVSLLKCMKKRTVVTTAKQNNHRAPLSAATNLQKEANWLKTSNVAKGFQTTYFKAKPIIVTTFPKRNHHTMVINSVSCTALKPQPRRRASDDWSRAQSATNLRHRLYSSKECEKSSLKHAQGTGIEGSKLNVGEDFCRCYGTSCGACCSPCGASCGPCCSPCGASCGPCYCPSGPCGPPCGPCYGNVTDCNCGRLLPPPCNTPPKCIQYMQGYYYYPYGTWFCGPYHVCTGGVPCQGPVCPGTSCGIAPPNPNLLCGKCGPCCGTSCCGVMECTLCSQPVSFGKGQCNMNQKASCFCTYDSPDPVNIGLANCTICDSVGGQKKGEQDPSSNCQGISEAVSKKYPFKNTANLKPEIVSLKCTPKNATKD